MIPATGETALRGLMLIHSVGTREPFNIRPLAQCRGGALGDEEMMVAKIQWATRAGYQVVTRNVPREHAPYNAIIRISSRGTEDQNRDYLAQMID